MKKIKINYNINFITKNKNKLNEILNKYMNEKKYYFNYTINDTNCDYVNVYVNNDLIYELNEKKYKNLDDLLHDNNIFPKLFDEDISSNNYKNKLINLEHKKDIEKFKIFKSYDEIINKNLDVLNGLNDVYEWYTGAVFFKDYEWNEINNSLKDLFEIKENNSFNYSLPIDNGIILRGDKIYYYFSTDVKKKKKPTIIQIKKWFENVETFLNKCLSCLANFKIDSNYDKRLILAVIDNLRNIILLLTNCELMNLSDNGKDFIYNEGYNNVNIKKYDKLILNYQVLIENICIYDKSENIVSEVINIIKKLSKLKNITLKNVIKIKDNFILSKCFNPLREIDNYLENYIVIKSIIDNMKVNKKKINIIGILYGGLELPFIFKRLSDKKTTISFLFENHGMYLDRQQMNKDEIIPDIIEYGKFDRKNPTYIIDDNMMSGITMQFAFNKLKVIGFNNIEGIMVIRHPNLNRFPQLKHFNVGLNLDLVDNSFILGMITPTPYTKIKESTNYNNMFVNELNIFSVMTEIFLKALYCNNSFIKDSQVDIFKGYSEGKND